MEKRKIGTLEVSKVAMGCMGFSHGYGEVPSREYSIEAIQKAYDYGCTFFDTAESYGEQMFYKGHNEEIVGEALKEVREQVVIATKLKIEESELEDASLYEVVKNHLQQSLKRLQTTYIDLYYLHRVNPNIPVEDVAKVMGQLIEEGVIKAWGLSQVSVETIQRVHEVTPLSAIQNIYSMMERDAENEVIPYCEAHNIGFVPFSPIASGFLSGKVTTETKFEGDDVRKFVPQLSKENMIANQPILDLLEDYAQKKSATKAQISLAWMLHKYPHVVPIPGSKNQERILENLKSNEVVLTNEEFDKLEKALDTLQVYGHRGQEEYQGSQMSDWGKE